MSQLAEPAVRARWMAVQAEPITFSGERITIAVAIVTDDGETRVAQALSEGPLEDAFGRFGKHLMTLAQQVIAELQAYLAAGGQLEQWVPHLQGITTGEIVRTSNDSLAEIEASALRHTSLFSAKANNRRHNAPGERQLANFQRHIKDLVTASRDDYARRFGHKVRVFGKTSTHYSYVGDHLAINLANIDPSLRGHSQQRDAAVRRLTQLAALRDHAPQFSHQIERLVMAVWVPPKGYGSGQQDLLDSYLDELNVDAKRLEIDFEPSQGRSMQDAAKPLARLILADS